MSKGRIVLTAGGTGGHLFPAQALADELVLRGWEIHLATDERADRFADEFPAEKIHIIPSASPSGKNPLRMASAAMIMLLGMWRCRALIKKLEPAAVVGFGGYPTVPPMLAAAWLGVPTIIHEANAVLGRANRFLSARVKAIAAGFELDDGQENSSMPHVVIGNPVRPAVIDAASTAYRQRHDHEPFDLLVFGGSQGAQFFSQVLPQALSLLSKKTVSQLRLVQQARPEDEASLQQAYQALKIDAVIAPFFSDMANRIAHSHLIISRAGASTVSEIAMIGRPAILVPYPHALDHDQAANAAGLAATGGAELHRQQDLTPQKLADILTNAIADPEGLAKSAENAKKAAKPDAAGNLANLVEHIAAGGTVQSIQAIVEQKI